MNVKDTLQNLVSGLGLIGRDKAASRVFAPPRFDQNEIDNAYRGDWMARKIVDIPAFDMTRAWRTVQVDRKDLALVEAEERRLGLRQKVWKALWWARLRGGAAILLDDGSADLSQPLNVTRRGGLKQIAVLPKEKVKAGELQWNPALEGFDLPAYYVITTGQKNEPRVHPSRVVTFMGSPVPAEENSAEFRVYGDPVLVALRDAVTQAAASSSAISALLEEAKVDIVRVPGLMANVLSNEYRDRMTQRWELAAVLKSINNVMLMDEKEQWDRKEANFSGLPDVARLFLQIVCGAADIPATRFLGQSPQGLNATGESDLQNYEAMIAARQENELAPRLEQIDRALLVSALGQMPKDGGWFRFNPLRLPTPKERREGQKQMADTAKIIADSGLVPTAALEKGFQNALIEEGLYPGLEDAIEEAMKGTLLPFEEPGDDETPEDQSEPEDPRDPNEAEKPREVRIPAGDCRALVQAPRPGKVQDAKPRSLYVSRPVVNSADLVAWAKSQGFPTVQEGLHVTIAFSKLPVDWMAVPSDWSFSGDDGTLTIPPGGARLVEPLGGNGAVVLLFNSGNLKYRHEEIVRAGASWDWDEYQPHVTITWDAPEDLDLSKVEPFRGPLVLGPEVFEQIVENWAETIKEA